jgi:hypothetical protein
MPGPDIWGPHGWKFIHYITLGYPNNPTEQDKKKYYNFFMSLSNVIPCSICGNHFKQHLEITPLDEESLKNKESLMAWGIKMHNHVNAKNNKKLQSIKDAIKAIINNDDKCLVFDNSDEQISTPMNNILNNLKNKKNQIKIEKFNNSPSTVLIISIILNILLILFLLYKLNKL